MRALNILLAFLVPVAMFLALFEGGLRLLGKGPDATWTEFDPRAGWVKSPGARASREGERFHATFEINSAGLRDDELEPGPKPPGETRVLFLGDSFTLGYTVEREHLFVDLLERWWGEEGREVVAINAGTQGYSTDQEVAWLRAHGSAFEPDLVVLLPYENDIYQNGLPAYNGIPKPLFGPTGELESGDLADPYAGGVPLHKRLAIAKLLHRPSPGESFGPAGGQNPAVPTELAPLLLDPPAEVLGDCFERTRGALIALRETCAEIGAQLVVAPIPSHSAIEPGMMTKFGSRWLGLEPSAWSPDRPVDLFIGWCQELDIPSLDSRAALRAGTELVHDEGGALLPDQSRRCYHDIFDVDREWHFNEHGNLTFARFLHEQLEGASSLPRPTQASALAASSSPEPQAPAGPPTWMLAFGALWLVLGGAYITTYRDEAAPLAGLKIGLLLSVIFGVVLGLQAGAGALGPRWGTPLAMLFVGAVLAFVAYKLGNRLNTIAELLKAFILRGHWYLMPVVVVLLTVGSLLVVAASSPLVAPFIYTLF